MKTQIEKIQILLLKISRSACLEQINDDKCICWSCEATKLLLAAEVE